MPSYPVDNEVERQLGLVPGLRRWDLADDLPYHNDPDVRRARGHRGESFFSSASWRIKSVEYWNQTHQVLEAAVYFSPLSEGTPGCVHGGAIATSFDHLFGRMIMRTVGFVGHATLSLTIDYKKFVPLDIVVRVTCDPVERNGRKIFVRGRMTNADGSVLYAQSSALFYNYTAKEVPYHEAVAAFRTMTRDQYAAAVANPASAAERAKPKSAKIKASL